MNIWELNPTTDPRWSDFVDRHPEASVFHDASWLRAVEQTYRYQPMAFTTSAPSEPLRNGVVGCQIRSWVTGRRLVCTPFSDHCQPLVGSAEEMRCLSQSLVQLGARRGWKYVELRPLSHPFTAPEFAPRPSCLLHTLDLTPDADQLLRRTHKTAIQQPIKRAEREGLACEAGYSEKLLQVFFRLTTLTRRRQQLPPQPISWFRHLAACLGDRLQIRVAFKDGQAIASILTLQFKQTLTYKYGCSDIAFQSLGATPYLIWSAILDAKARGLACMDFGRSDLDNTGLITFKNRWGAVPRELQYVRWSRRAARSEGVKAEGRKALAGKLFAVLPDSVLQAAGGVLYRHVG